MFALPRTWVEHDLFPMLSLPVFTYLEEGKRKASPDFLWSLLALANLMRLSLLKAAHAVMSGAAYRKSGSPHLLQPMYAKVREHGAPVQGGRLVSKREICRTRRLARQAACSLGGVGLPVAS
jgi:hypothetical protein